MFTENQVRQFYVATGTAADVIAPVEVDSSHAATDLSAKSDGACQFVLGPNKDEFYLQYKGPKDGPQRSDIIKICNVTDVRLTGTKDMVHKMRKLEVALDSNVSSTPIKGQEYILNVEIKNYIALGYNSTKVKFGAAIATTNVASDIYKKLAINLAKNFAREAVPMISISLKTANSPVAVTSKTKFADLSSTTATGIILEEVEQPWRLGAAKQEFVNFDAYPSTITDADGVQQIWGAVTDVTASNTNKLPNTKAVADMEYFFHKERGDVYGYAGFPNNIDTVYQVDATNAYGYSFIDIHYYFEGNSHNVGHSEKTLTIVVPGASSDPEANAQKLVGAAATTGQSATPASGLYAWLEGTGVNIKVSPNWDA